MERKFGKLPPQKDIRTFKFAKYFDQDRFKRPPAHFGHDNLYDKFGWGMLKNDELGCCVVSSIAHQTMLWNKASKNIDIPFTDEIIEKTYYEINGTTEDRGTSMIQSLNFRRKTGITDAEGKNHKIFAYLQLETGNWKQLLIAMYQFGLVDIGFQVPTYVFDQMDKGKPWTVKKNMNFTGGHCVPLVGKTPKYLNCVTWGQEQFMSRSFYEATCDEAYVILSEGYFNEEKKTPEGFDFETLKKDLYAL